MDKVSLFIYALLLTIIAYGCQTKEKNNCSGSESFCTAKKLIQMVDDAETKIYKQNKLYTKNFDEIKPRLNIESLPLDKIFEMADKIVFTTKDKEHEITIKLYDDHVRVKISPPPVNKRGRREPYCLMKKFGSKEINTCKILL